MDVYTAAITELLARLAWHTTAGQTPARLLDGWAFNDKPMSRMDGIKNFPAVSLTIPEMSEAYRPRVFGVGTMKFEFFVSTKTGDVLTVHTAAIALALDAIERRGNLLAAVDAGLHGALAKPFEASVGNAQITDLSLNSKVTLTLMVRPFERGNRRRL